MKRFNTKCTLCGKGIRLSENELIHRKKAISCSYKCQHLLRKKGIKSVNIEKSRQWWKGRYKDDDIHTKINSPSIK